MKLEQQVIPCDLAKRLKELGAPQESLYRWRRSRDIGSGGGFEWHLDGLRSGEYTDEEYAAFTVSELEELVPREINVPYKNGKPRDDAHWRSMQRVHKGFRIAYQNRRYSSDSWFEQVGTTFAEAFGKMFVYLLENSYIKP